MKNVKLKIRLPNTIGKQYDILIVAELLESLIVFIEKQNVSKVVVITDNNVKKKYGNKLLRGLRNNLEFFIFNLISFPSGEKYKNQETVSKLQNEMFKQKCGRDTLIIALGGGVVGDVAGYTAATYMRGVPYVQIPTTLLAMVDSSVGGKTGVDTKYGKNLVGSFWQPEAVYIDPAVLTTLPKKHLVNGLIEAVKMFITYDKKMFDYVMKNYDSILNLDIIVLQKVITRAVEIKTGVVMRDEREGGERSVLNFGHTIGHAIEKLSNYKILHGEAVGLGILVEAKIAEFIGELLGDVYDEMEGFLKKIVDIKILRSYDIENIVEETKLDKKTQGGKVKYVLLKDIGRICNSGGKFVHGIDDDVVRKALLYFKN